MDRLEHKDGREAWEELDGVKTFRVVNAAGENMAEAVCRQMSDGRWLQVDEEGYCILTEHENGKLTLVPDAESEKTKTISICVDNVWAGDGKILDGEIRDCAAQLGGDQEETEVLYSMIEDAIEAGKDCVTCELNNGQTASIEWSING